MTRINTLQERKVSVTNNTELAFSFLHKIKKKSTILLQVSWALTGAPNSVSVTGVVTMPLPGSTPSTRVPLKYQALAGAGSAAPIYAGTTGNALGCAVLAVSGDDLRSVGQNSNPTNIVIQFSGTVARATVMAIELANFPAFKYRDVKVTTVNNQVGTAMTLSSSQRPMSLDLVGFSIATQNTRAVKRPWLSGDSRYFEKMSVAQELGELAPWAFDGAAGGVTFLALLGGIADPGDPFRGLSTLIDSVATSPDPMPFPFGNFPSSASWGPVPEGEVADMTSGAAFADWLTDVFRNGIREGQEQAVWITYFMNTSGNQSAETPIFIISREYLRGPSSVELLNGGAPPEVTAILPADLQNGDVVITDGVSLIDEITELRNRVATGENVVMGIPTIELEEVNLFAFIHQAEGGPSFSGVLGSILNFIDTVNAGFRLLVNNGVTEDLPPV